MKRLTLFHIIAVNRDLIEVFQVHKPSKAFSARLKFMSRKICIKRISIGCNESYAIIHDIKPNN